MPMGLSGSNSGRGHRPRPQTQASWCARARGRAGAVLAHPAASCPPGRPPTHRRPPRCTHGCHYWVGAATEHSTGPWCFSPWHSLAQGPSPTMPKRPSILAHGEDNLKPKTWQHRLAWTRPALAGRRGVGAGCRGGAWSQVATPTTAH